MSEPQWLSHEQQQVWRLYLEVSQRLWARLGRELSEGTGVSMSEYDVMVKLSEAPERTLRMSELASRTTQSRSRVTHTVTRMEAAGLVERRPSTVDGRGVACTLTAAGLASLQAAAPVHVASVREHFVEPLADLDLEQARVVLERVAEHLRAVDPNKAPFNPTP